MEKEINTEDRKSGRNSIIAPKQLHFALLDLIIALNSGKFCFSDILISIQSLLIFKLVLRASDNKTECEEIPGQNW